MSVLAGAVVVLCVSIFVPFVGQIAGGAVSGYLKEGSHTTGAKLGAAASGLAALPGLLIAVLIFGLGILGSFAGGEAANGLLFGVILVVVIVFVVVLAAGLGALGGYVGAVVAED